MSISCERLVFLTPSINDLLSHDAIQYLCVSEVRSIRSFLKCCYICLQNLLLEILEVTNLSEAENFAFFHQAQSLSQTQFVATGLRTDNLDLALESLKHNGIYVSEIYANNNSSYPKGYKHKSADLNLKWFNRTVYLTEYDNLFFEERKSAMIRDLRKQQTFSVIHSTLLFHNNLPPSFIKLINSKLHLNVQKSSNPSLEGMESLNLDWLTLQWSGKEIISFPTNYS